MDFIEWCWIILQRLQLYSPPQNANIYGLSAGDAPFESIDSATLSTLRGHANNNPLAAYTMLLMSELGHRFGSFNEQKMGWSLLQVLLKTGHYRAFLKTIYQLFHTYYATFGPSVFESDDFKELLASFWKQITNQNFLEVSDMLTMGLADRRDDFRMNETSIQYCLCFWTSAAFSNRNWSTSRNCLHALEMLVQPYFENGCQPLLLDTFGKEYQKQVNAHQLEQAMKAPTFASPLKVIYGLALGAVGHFTNPSFPTLVMDADESNFTGFLI
jgi:hypothetical protein